jgi:chromosome partitioning protein
MARVIAICNAKGGVGKCLAPETPVLLADGEVLSIEKVFERYADAAAPKMFDEEGGFFVRPSGAPKVLSWNDDLSVVPAEVAMLYRGKADRLFEVASNKGKTVRVTARHPFLVLRGGVPTWIRADELEKGDFIATPRRAPVAPGTNVTDLAARFPESLYVRVKDRAFIGSHLAEILSAPCGRLPDRILWRLLREKEASANRLYALANKPAVFRHLSLFYKQGIVERKRTGKAREFQYRLNREAAVDYVYARGFSAKTLEQHGWSRGIVKEMYHLTRSGHACAPMRPIFELDEDLAKFIALLLAEGSLGPSRAVFFNSSPELLDCFTACCEKFGFLYQKKDLGSQWRVTIRNTGTLMNFLEKVFQAPVRGRRKSSRVAVPSAILQAPREILAAYLGAYLDCEGYVAKDRSTVQISSASGENIMRLHYAFLRFEINGSLGRAYKSATNSPDPKRRLYHSLTITGVPYMRAILANIPLMVFQKRERLEKAAAMRANTNLDVVPVGELMRSVRERFGLRQGDIGLQGTITDYEDGTVMPSREAARNIASAVLERTSPDAVMGEAMAQLVRFATSDVFWERVAGVKIIPYQGYVYDLTVENTHNFAAGNGAFIVHNTTTAVNVGAYLAALGRKVLLIDFDPQANASSALGHAPSEVLPSVYHGVIGAAPYGDVIRATQIFNYHVIPSAPHLAGALVEFVEAPEREYFLRKFVNQFRHHYDYILIDLPPSLSLLTVNGLVAADEIIIPVQAEYYSLEGLGQLLETIALIETNLRHPIRIAGAVLTMYDGREHLSREISKNLRRHFPHHVFDVEIPRAVALAEAPSFGKPILLYKPDSEGAFAYRRLADEIIAQEKDLHVPKDPVASEGFGNFNIEV